MSDFVDMKRFTAKEYDRILSFIGNHKAKIRAGSKTIINTKTMVLKSIPTIEVRVAGHQFMPLDFGGECFFPTKADRDVVLSKLKGKSK